MVSVLGPIGVVVSHTFHFFSLQGTIAYSCIPRNGTFGKSSTQKVTFEGCDGICDRSQEGTPSACKNALLWLAHFVQPIMDLQGHPPPSVSVPPPPLGRQKKSARRFERSAKFLTLIASGNQIQVCFSAVVVVQGKLQYIYLEKKHVSTSGKRKGSYFHVYLESNVILQIVGVCACPCYVRKSKHFLETSLFWEAHFCHMNNHGDSPGLRMKKHVNSQPQLYMLPRCREVFVPCVFNDDFLKGSFLLNHCHPQKKPGGNWKCVDVFAEDLVAVSTNSIYFERFSPRHLGNIIQFDKRAYFSNGLSFQPPTSKWFWPPNVPVNIAILWVETTHKEDVGNHFLWTNSYI